MNEIMSLKRKYHYSNYFLCFMMFVFWGYVVYLLWPIKVFEILKDPAPVLIKSVKVNGTIQYRLNRIKYYNVSTEITYQFVDGTAYFIPYVFLTHQATGERNTVITLQVPPIPPGKYRIRVTIRSLLPLFKTVINSFETEEFEIYD